MRRFARRRASRRELMSPRTSPMGASCHAGTAVPRTGPKEVVKSGVGRDQVVATKSGVKQSGGHKLRR